MSSHIVPTVTIVRDGVEVRINKSDYDPKIHKLVGEVVEKKQDKSVKKSDTKKKTQQPEELFVFPTAEGKFQIIGSDGKSVDGEVYETQEDAEKVLLGE